MHCAGRYAHVSVEYVMCVNLHLLHVCTYVCPLHEMSKLEVCMKQNTSRAFYTYTTVWVVHIMRLLRDTHQETHRQCTWLQFTIQHSCSPPHSFLSHC